MSLRVALDDVRYKVGESYVVPCIKARTVFTNGSKVANWGGEWIPVLGPVHRDAEIINFPFLHYHVDWRFVSERVFQRVARDRLDRFVLAQPLMVHPSKPNERAEDEKEMVVESVVPDYRMRECKREMQTWFSFVGYETVRWMKGLEESCAHLKMENMVCPHRGTPLKGCPQDGDVVHCPNHGLRWNVKTGELVR